MMKALVVALSLWAPAAMAADLCQTLSAKVAKAGDAPLLLESWQGPDGSKHPQPALAGAAFTYDNALAALALVACGDLTGAAKIGDGLLMAVAQDRASPKRLRNAYRAGTQTSPPPPHGWWAVDHWAEDPYQVGTSTGNVAWAGIALAQLGKTLGRNDYKAAAVTLGDWAWDMRGGSGFYGGVDGDGEGQRLDWQATEHAIDLSALYTILGNADRVRFANNFIASQWKEGHLLTGLTPEGKPNTATSGLDAQFWAVMLPNGGRYGSALDYAIAKHGVPGGFDFNDDKDGMWTEGTAQGALAFYVMGRKTESAAYLKSALAQQAPNGMLFATDKPEITTGLAIGPQSTTDDFRYYRWPHLGATAWAIMAQKGFNPLR